MKIYAHTNSNYSLDDFIGENVWVLCQRQLKHSALVLKEFVMVLYKTPKGYCVYNVPDFTFRDLPGCSYEVVESTLYESRMVDFDTYEVVQPIEVFSAAETFESAGLQYNSDYTKFDDFIGKDAWVSSCRVRNRSYTIFVRVLSRNETTITYNYIPLSYFEYAGNGEDWDSFNRRMNTPTTSHIDEIIINEPLDVYTTEELQDWFGRELEKANRG